MVVVLGYLFPRKRKRRNSMPRSGVGGRLCTVCPAWGSPDVALCGKILEVVGQVAAAVSQH